MLILPPGHAEARAVRYRLSTRERWILGGVLATVAAVVVAVVISLGSSERQTSAGCVDVKFPITIGGEEIYQCGSRARALCTSTKPSNSPAAVVDRAVAEQCRKAGLPVG